MLPVILLNSEVMRKPKLKSLQRCPSRKQQQQQQQNSTRHNPFMFTKEYRKHDPHTFCSNMSKEEATVELLD